MNFLEKNLEQFEEGAINTASGLGIGLVSAFIDPGLFKVLTLGTSGYLIGRNAPETIGYFNYISNKVGENIKKLRR